MLASFFGSLVTCGSMEVGADAAGSGKEPSGPSVPLAQETGALAAPAAPISKEGHVPDPLNESKDSDVKLFDISSPGFATGTPAQAAQGFQPAVTISNSEGLGIGSGPKFKVGGQNLSSAAGSAGVSLLGVRAAELKKALYDPNAKLVDLFGDLEPKLMLDAIMETFWDSWISVCVYIFVGVSFHT